MYMICWVLDAAQAKKPATRKMNLSGSEVFQFDKMKGKQCVGLNLAFHNHCSSWFFSPFSFPVAKSPSAPGASLAH